MSFDCQINEQADQPTPSIRTHSAVKDLPAALERALRAITLNLEELGRFPSGAPFAGYFNMDMQNLDVVVEFPVAKQVLGRAIFKVGPSRGGKRLLLCTSGRITKLTQPTTH